MRRAKRRRGEILLAWTVRNCHSIGPSGGRVEWPVSICLTVTLLAASMRIPKDFNPSCIAFLFCLLLIVSPFPRLGAENTTKRQEVAKLIDQLGAPSYATRLRAKEKLQRIGLEAFDQLQAARDHVDSEISMSARFLISSLIVSWSKESDPPEIREALAEYGARSPDERSARIDMLVEFPNRRGIAALARLTRFETSPELSRRAALGLMSQAMSTDEMERKRNSQAILSTLEDTDRQTATWLRAYAEDLSAGEYKASRWEDLIVAQRDAIDAIQDPQATRRSALDLVRICARRANDLGDRDEALRLANANLDLIAPTTRDLVEASTWAIDNELHPFVLELRQRFRRLFDQHPMLLYDTAEAHRVEGNDEAAERIAKVALEIRPLPKNETEREKFQPKQLDEAARGHYEIAKTLEERGLFRWAEREYRSIVDAVEVTSGAGAQARSALAQMLGELERHLEVVDVLSPLLDRAGKDAKLNARLNELYLPFNRFQGTMDYHAALALMKEGKKKEASKLLARAHRSDSRNVDILIAMYRLDLDEEWNRSVRSRLSQSLRHYEMRIEAANSKARQFGNSGDTLLAEYLNEYAWLVCNTEGDFDRALQYSLKSLNLTTDYAKLDTCGRCYFALREFDKAIEMQKRALKLMPHSPPLVRQLEEFEAAKEKFDSERSAEADSD